MLKRLFIILLLGLVALPALGAGGLVTDEVSVQYPLGYTKLLVADLAKLVGQEELETGLCSPLAAAHHPLTGIYNVLAMLQLDPTAAEYVAYGTGPEISPLALVRGLGPLTVMEALRGVKNMAGAPGSPFTSWKTETINGVPVVFIGAAFGVLRIQWAYIVTEHTLWIVTEVAFGGEPDVARLRSSAELVIDRMRGRVGCFSELPIAVAVRGGDLAFVRVSDSAVDRPVEPGEQAMGYTVSFAEGGAEIHFALRFSSVAAAAGAQGKIAGGESGYLAQDLYRGELEGIKRVNRDLYFDVATGLPGIIGLLLLTIPM